MPSLFFSKKRLIMAILILVLILVFIFFLWPKARFQTAALTGNMFGGKIKTMMPCLHPFTGFYIELSGPTAGDFIYMAGTSKSYLFGPPYRPGQWLLGMTSVDTYCFTAKKHGKWRNPKSGRQILFHGSSI